MELALQHVASLIIAGEQVKKKKKKRSKTTVVPPQLHFDLVKLNGIVEDITSPFDAPNNSLPVGIWEEWIFRSNPNQLPNASSLLNRCQLLGLLICRYRAARQPSYKNPIILEPSRLVIIHNKAPAAMTLRELRDSLSNLVLQRGVDIHLRPTRSEDSSIGPVLLYLDACLHRFGELVWATWPCASSSPISDDVGSIEKICVDNGLEHDQVTLTCIRNLINTFLMAYRLVTWIQMSAKNLSDGDDDLPSCTPIHHHHVSASIDVFYNISMYYDLPPAAR